MKKIILLLLVCTSISSCTYRWYREFLPDEHLSKQETYGWAFKPVLYAYKNIAGDNTPRTPNEFNFDIYVENKDKFNTELKDIMIDSVSITLYPNYEILRIDVLDYLYFSNPNQKKSLDKSFSLGIRGNHYNKVEISEDIDSVKISFNAKFFDGVLNKFEKVTNIDSDTVYVQDSSDYDVVPIEFMMYRHESKTKIPAFFKRM